MLGPQDLYNIETEALHDVSEVRLVQWWPIYIFSMYKCPFRNYIYFFFPQDIFMMWSVLVPCIGKTFGMNAKGFSAHGDMSSDGMSFLRTAVLCTVMLYRVEHSFFCDDKR